jgi:hypothetical protein
MDAVAQASRTTKAPETVATLTVHLALGFFRAARSADLMAKQS